MNIAIILAIMVAVFFLCILARKLGQEYELVNMVKASTHQMINSFYTPLSVDERAKLIENKLNNLREVQDKLPRTILAKYFVNCTSIIEASEKMVKERMAETEDTNENYISFDTANLHRITADSSFDSANLHELGNLIDEMNDALEAHGFPSISSYVNVSCHNNVPMIEIRYKLNVLNEKLNDIFQTYVNEISESVFELKPVTLNIAYDSEDLDEDISFEFASNSESRPEEKV